MNDENNKPEADLLNPRGGENNGQVMPADDSRETGDRAPAPAGTEPQTKPLAKPKKLSGKKVLFAAIAVLILALLAWGAVYLLPGPGGENNRNNRQTQVEQQDLFSGFSKLVINPANADDNFEFRPDKSDSLGADPGAIYILKSKQALSTAAIEENIKISPDFEYDIKKISDYEWQIIPKQPLVPNTLVHAVLAASYVDQSGGQTERDYSWVYQVKDSFKVIHSVPRDTGTRVPVNTGIEFTFSHDNFKDYQAYFEITPDTRGRFEQHGRTLVFVPDEQLSPATVYTAKIKKGLPLDNSDETLSRDYAISFETQPDNNPEQSRSWFSVNDRFIEANTQDPPLLQIYAQTMPDNKINAAVYAFSGWQAYLDSLKKRDLLPWWSYSKEDFLEDTGGLDKIGGYELEIKSEDQSQYLQFPDILPRGFYLIELTKDKTRRQVWLQVSDLATYLNVTKTKTIIWVNDAGSKQPAAGAEIKLLGTDYKYSANGEGVSEFATPAEIIARAQDKNENERYYFRISRGEDAIIMPASQVSLNYEWNSPVSAEDYWNYFYTDRPRYQSTDTVKYWGMLKTRDQSPIKDPVAITLYKEGYVDYYYRPVRIAENRVALSENNIFTGEFELKDLRPDYYTLELTVGGRLIERKYITVRPYIKPAYQLNLIPERTRAFAGDNVKLKVKASFFEGTPVPDLRLVYKTPAGEQTVTTDELGEVDLSYTKAYSPCPSEYGCWPEYEYLTIRPEASELAEITADTYINFYGPKVYLDGRVEYPEAGVAEIKFSAKQIDLDAMAEADYWWSHSLGDEPAAGAKIEGKVTKITYTRQETGTYYDFINKITYKKYRYTRNEETVDSFSAVTDSQGQYLYRRTVDPDTSYRVNLKIYDQDGRYDNYQRYIYYWNGSYLKRYSDGQFTYYHLDLPEDKDYYRVGEEVVAQFMRNDEPMPDGSGRYLYLQLKNGLQAYSLGDGYEYRFKFQADDIPNVNLLGVYFNGFTYISSHTGYWGGRSVVYDYQERTLKIKVTPDKEKYQPGGPVELTVETTDLNDRPKPAEVNLNLVDEAYYAIAGDQASPLETLYANLGPGTLFTAETHENLITPSATAEKGGCFAAGTMITMANGGLKPIEEIKQGDRIMTFSDPLGRELSGGEVAEVWQHQAVDLLIINGRIKVTPEHQFFSNGRFIDAGLLKAGDWLLTDKRTREIIKTIEIRHEPVAVYNFKVEPQHTYFAQGIYVHNQEKGGGAREFFTDAALFESVKTDSSGRAKVNFTLPDNITSWRVTAQGISPDLYAGVSVSKIPVSLPVFEEITVGDEYLVKDKPVARMRAFGTALTAGDQVRFSVSAPTLGDGNPFEQTAAAFQPAYYPLPALKSGTHDLVYSLDTAKGKDAVKLPLKVVNSRLEAVVAKDSKLATDTKIVAENDLPITVVLSDQGQNRLYNPLLGLSWSWGDRVDQVYARQAARLLLDKYYREDIILPKFEAFDYQTTSGGIALLPYSGEELELSARIADLGADGFDRISLAQYFYNILENKDSNREEVSYSLYGLASLKEPVLPRIQSWLAREDLSVKEKLYLAQALYNLGAEEWSRSLYYGVMNDNGEKKDPYIIVRTGKTADDTFEATARAAVLAAALNAPESEGLWKYLTENQKLYGPDKNSERLYNLEKLDYIEQALPNLKPSPARVAYEFSGERKEAKLTGGQIHSFLVDPSQVDQVRFTAVEGDVGISMRYIEPLSTANTNRDPSLEIRREYYVNGKKTDTVSEGDTVEVRLYPKFSQDALAGDYQITDILPSGLMAVTELDSRNRSHNCHYRYPYNSDNQIVKYRINRDWRSDWCGGDYIAYYARVKNRGEYIAEPAVIQSYENPEYINYSEAETIKIQP